MALKLNIKNIPPSLKIVIVVVPAVILIILFVLFIYLPKNKEIKKLDDNIVKLDNEIASSEVKARKLGELKVENKKLKARLTELQEQLPEEEEVSGLLKQISDLGLKSGLEILLWKPQTRQTGTGGLYVEMPVQVSTVGGYHDLGAFFSHISGIKRIVNLSNIKITAYSGKDSSGIIKADFIASTFSAITEAEKAEAQKVKKRGKRK